MKKIIINENQKGFLFKNGKYVKLLDAGKYHAYGDREIMVNSPFFAPSAPWRLCWLTRPWPNRWPW